MNSAPFKDEQKETTNNLGISNNFYKESINLVSAPQQSNSNDESSKIHEPLINYNKMLEFEISQQEKKKSGGIDFKKCLFLFTSALLTTGVFYQMSVLILLRKEIKHQYPMSDGKFSLLFTIPSGISVCVTWCMGIVNDNLGPHRMLMAYTFVAVIALTFFQFAQEANNYTFTMVYSVLAAVSQEAITVAQNTITSMWFIGGSLTFAMGVLVLNIRITEIISSNTIPDLYNIDGLSGPVITALSLCCLSFLVSIAVYFQERKRQKFRLRKKREYQRIQQEIQQIQQRTDISNAQLQELVQNMQYFNEMEQKEEEELQKLKQKKQKRVKIQDIRNLSLNFWMSCIIAGIGYSSFYPFLQKMQELGAEKFKIDSVQAGRIQSIIYFISMAGPFLGILIDKIGRRSTFMIVAFVFQTIAFMLWSFLPGCEQACFGIPLIPAIFHGLFLCIFASVTWSCFPIITQPQYLGTAFAITSSIKGIGMSAFPQFQSFLSTQYGVITICYFLIGYSFLGLILSIIQFYVDKNRGFLLHRYKRNGSVSLESCSQQSLQNDKEVIGKEEEEEIQDNEESKENLYKPPLIQ